MTTADQMTAGRERGGRPVGYAPWHPQGATQIMVDHIVQVLVDFADWWPITPRQILYRLIGRGQATKADAGRVGEYLNRGRRAGLVPWEAVGDGRTEAKVPRSYDGPDDFYKTVRTAAGQYRVDRQAGQPVHIEVVVEAAGAVAQMFRTTEPYGIPVYSGSGFMPITALRQFVERAARREVPTVVLVAGDYDPAGSDIRARVEADIEAFDERYGTGINVQSIALTEPQVDDLGLIRTPLPPKKRERWPWWPHPWTVELEAVTPADLAGIVVAAIDDLTNTDARQAVISREADERAQILGRLDGGAT